MSKYIVLVGDGMGDYPLETLGGKTPLEAAHTPNMDFIASNGVLGLVETVPDGMPPGSDIANMSLLGFDPKKYHTGRGPIEAASLGIKVNPEDIIFRCNLVSLGKKEGAIFMEDYSAGHISSEEAKELILTLNKYLGSERFHFYPGVSYRHILVWHNGKNEFTTIPPHEIPGQEVTDYLNNLPSEIRELVINAKKILVNHPVNQQRVKEGKKMANSIWPWGQGRMTNMPSFKERFGLKGGVISAVDLIKGIGILAGLKVINVPGATGYFDTNYKGKVQYALDALKELDFVYVHVEAPDEAGHEGNLAEKIKAIEAFDQQVVGSVLNAAKRENIKVMVTMDHYTPVAVRTHIGEPVPFAIFLKRKIPASFRLFCERIANESGILVKPGYKLMECFLRVD
ncbi:putative homoserine kinase [Candidatus Desulfofervidus auxilii]|uniref:Putative homoserine kinase n=1 Tax=Desulfofervidus auxilii TaxID=1621989 RepID=A0A7U4TJ75_DESA2|nr:cofactor-independent phosphoglycerate mutase [Candidatus Desulfofervidus auxilii]AMM42286.1 putative homoserine kinase [Candidatus Desulfofervidus auxilii]CAD7782434.1 2,3-bisphosphoglycerate-independent phosphoglycerate mutase [Candidatus Methanoperedenaceae archaeon GB37]